MITAVIGGLEVVCLPSSGKLFPPLHFWLLPKLPQLMVEMKSSVPWLYCIVCILLRTL